jgi:hypothetical protein
MRPNLRKGLLLLKAYTLEFFCQLKYIVTYQSPTVPFSSRVGYVSGGVRGRLSSERFMNGRIELENQLNNALEA